MKNNCENCEHLKWESGDVNDPEGFVCTKRRYFMALDFDKAERDHQKKLNNSDYRLRAKICFDPKNEASAQLRDRGEK